MKISPKCGYSMMLYLMYSRACYTCTCCEDIEDAEYDEELLSDHYSKDIKKEVINERSS